MEEKIEKKDIKSEEKNWKEKANNTLKERKSPLRVVNIVDRYAFIILLFIILILGGIFYYFTANHYFSPTFVDNSSCINTCPVIPSCPSCPSQTINVSLSIPDTLNLNVAKINFTGNNS